jgi:hypothetical protein
MLGGSVAPESDLETIIPVHAGVPCDIKCDSGNYFGTQADAAAAFEDAARRVLQAEAHQRFKRVSEDRPVRFHEKDLDEFIDMLDRGEITTLAKQHRSPLANWAFWSAERQQRHVAASEAGGASAKGRMSGPERDKHVAASEAGGASAKGAMSEPERDKHVAACELGGGSAKGAMSGPERDKHVAAIELGYRSRTKETLDQAHLDRHRTMMQLANGKVGQQNLWECCTTQNGSATLYHFRAANEATIQGVLEFKKYLLDVRNGYVHDNLTKEGAEARIAMEKQRKIADKSLAARERKRQREEK